MKPYLEILWFILLPILLATVINRLANNKRVGNIRIVLYKLFQFAVILAIASQIQFDFELGDLDFIIAVLGYILLFALVFDMFYIYPKTTSPSKLMMVSNITLWIVGFGFFFTILSHYMTLADDPEWNTFNPMTHDTKIWNERTLPKSKLGSLDTKPSKNLFNLFSSVNKSNQTISTPPVIIAPQPVSIE